MTIGLGAGAGFRVPAIAMAFAQTGESGGKSRWWVGWGSLSCQGLSGGGHSEGVCGASEPASADGSDF